MEIIATGKAEEVRNWIKRYERGMKTTIKYVGERGNGRITIMFHEKNDHPCSRMIVRRTGDEN